MKRAKKPATPPAVLLPSSTPLAARSFAAEFVSCDELKAHPRNYRKHPTDQLDHIVASIEQHGFYRNVVVANDNTILAGHGVVEAARKAGLTEVAVVRLDIESDSPAALKLLAGDNEISRLGEVDDRALTELLKEIMADDPAALIGTGYDESQLAALLMVTRHMNEIADFDAAQEWVGMPKHDIGGNTCEMHLTFATDALRLEACALLGLDVEKIRKQIKSDKRGLWMTWWPDQINDDLSAVSLEADEASPA